MRILFSRPGLAAFLIAALLAGLAPRTVRADDSPPGGRSMDGVLFLGGLLKVGVALSGVITESRRDTAAEAERKDSRKQDEEVMAAGYAAISKDGLYGYCGVADGGAPYEGVARYEAGSPH